MERSLFRFVWRHSWRAQLMLLAVTLAAFPFLYASLELPKRIVNDAISGPETTEIAGIAFTQIQLLALLCAGFLGAVVAQGLVKMRLNTLKGIVAERLLRRLRYRLIDRVTRFPPAYFRRTSQGELVSMITAEAEPMGGVMGDMLAQPVFQGGMMLTIATFLFLQNVWLGLAAVALVPLQAWLIPMLQRRINRLNKKRVVEVRALAGEIGETAAGAAALRLNGGRRRRLAAITDRLGRLFEIRYEIYRQKFFMKFLNNFITQLTPFLFYAIGGYLAIEGELTVGALVAAIAAYKDLAAPWRELLAYVNRAQEAAQRWRIVTERFAPRGMVGEALIENPPETPESLAGPIEIDHVTSRDPDGTAVLEDLTLTIPPGASVAVTSRSANERETFAALITREARPAQGTVRLAGLDLATLHQDTIAARIGLADTRPALFEGTIGENLTMALNARPDGAARRDAEATRAGNSPDPLDADWLVPARAGLTDREALGDWWLAIVEAMGTADFLFRRGLDARFDPQIHPRLAERLVALRPEIARRIEAAGLWPAVHRFREDAFNPGLPLAGNLLWATPRVDIRQEAMAGDPRFARLVAELGLERELMDLGRDVLSLLARVFGLKGIDHPLFLRLGIEAGLFQKLVALETRAREYGLDALTPPERALLLTVPFRFPVESLGAPLPKALKARVLAIRAERSAELRAVAADVFEPIDPERIGRGLSVVENAVFGKLSAAGGAKTQMLRDLVSEVLEEDGLRREVAALIYDVPVTVGGANLPQIAHERVAFVRAVIKKPDILILDRALASHDEVDRAAMRGRLRRLLPETTLIFLEESFRDRASVDMHVEIEEGRLVGSDRAAESDEEDANRDLSRKIRALEKTEPFAGLERRQLRLLAFSSRWVEAEAGETLFHAGEAADGAYLIVKGEAALRWPDAGPADRDVSVVMPGRMIGDLSVLMGEPRRHDLVATTRVKGLRIGAEGLRSVVENDAAVATSLLRTVSGHLMDLGGRVRDERRERSRRQEPAE